MCKGASPEGAYELVHCREVQPGQDPDDWVVGEQEILGKDQSLSPGKSVHQLNGRNSRSHIFSFCPEGRPGYLKFFRCSCRLLKAMLTLLSLKRRCLYDMQEEVLWFHLHLVSRTNRWALQVFVGLKINDVTSSRLRVTFNNRKKTTLAGKNGIEITSSFKNTKGTWPERPKGFNPQVQSWKINLPQWEKDAVWVGKDGS